MRFAMVFAAGVLWAGIAAAQPDPAPGASNAPAPAAASGEQTAASPGAQPASTPAVTDHNHEIVCRTSEGTGSRLSRHSNRVCKTREQWEIEAQQVQHELDRAHTSSITSQ